MINPKETERLKSKIRTQIDIGEALMKPENRLIAISQDKCWAIAETLKDVLKMIDEAEKRS